MEEWFRHKNVSVELKSHIDNMYGVMMKKKQDNLPTNTILIMAKFYIHQSKFMKTPPIFKAFYNEFKLYCKSLKYMNSNSANKLLNYIQCYKLIEPDLIDV